ncbi:MAG: tetratricopeptide repeat protein [Promethearchaeota archaeon]
MLLNAKKLNINTLLDGAEPLTFLIGAGCSVDPPSNLLDGQEMMNEIIRYFCHPSEIDQLLKIQNLRFEQLIEILQDRGDHDLNCLKYYEECDKPNINHFFLAKKIKEGHFVMSTNFDLLIEQALLESGIPRYEIVPVITRQDFEKFNNPVELYQRGKKGVYKIHGSTKNFITEESTQKSLVATIQSFGQFKEGMNIFQIEPFKRPLFENISKDRNLIIMGYSGSDDFDIVPTLKLLENLKSIVWINHVKRTENIVLVREIKKQKEQFLRKLDHIEVILTDIKQMNEHIPIYLVNADTSKLIREVLKAKKLISVENFSLKPAVWFEKNVSPSNELIQFHNSYRIYKLANQFDAAERCLKNVLRLAEESDDLPAQFVANNNLGVLYLFKGSSEAFEWFNSALGLCDQLKDNEKKAFTLINIGGYFIKQKEHDKAQIWYEKASTLINELESKRLKSLFYTGMGAIYSAHENFNQAHQNFMQALEIDKERGNLPDQAIIYNNLAFLETKKEKFPEALEFYHLSLKIDTLLGNLKEKAYRLNNIGKVHFLLGNETEALKFLEEAYLLFIRLGLEDTREALLIKKNIDELKN